MTSLSDVILLSLLGCLIYLVIQESVLLSIAVYLAAGFIWFFRMRQLPRWNQPMLLHTDFGKLRLITSWPVGAYYFYSDRWRFRQERYTLTCHEKDQSSGEPREVLATFASWNEAVIHAKQRAHVEGLTLDITDTWRNRNDPWSYYISSNGRIHRSEEDGISELCEGVWRRI